MKASEKTKENQDEKRPKPVFQESSSLYPNLIDLETELSPPPYADPNPPLLPQILYTYYMKDIMLDPGNKKMRQTLQQTTHVPWVKLLLDLGKYQ
ncbi:hypothetical protein JEQ12_017497 [Ovis aries]|uniref:Uncharacterized protein n=1 Tax=Ovis aries TaxID=9940 RepID=A0A836AEM1_SHEEP|nr:hypothetical protein JEQ12_017497 [Ovis aries]